MASEATHLPIRPGDVIADKYSVISILGEGGMGYVVAARHIALGQLVAIKLMLPMSLRSEEAIARFLREARAVGALTSDHVARILDFGTSDGGYPYIVMEHLAGQTLGALAERGPMPVRDAVGFMLEVGDALTDAHSLGIVHRDLKPENVFIVQKANGKRYAKVLDFGVSRIDNPEIAGGMRALTATGASLGTPAFMAPEQISPKKPPGPKVDVWALGATLYAALTARLPFESESLYELPIKIHGEPPTPIRTHRPDLPDALVAVISDCLVKDPDARPALPEILARLEAIRAADPSHSSAKTVTAPAVEPSQRAQPIAQPIARPTSDPTMALQRPPVERAHMMTPRETAPLRTVSPLTRTPGPVQASSLGSQQTQGLVAVAIACAILGAIGIGVAIQRRGHARAATAGTSDAASSLSAPPAATASPSPSIPEIAAPIAAPTPSAEPDPTTRPKSATPTTTSRARPRPARAAGTAPDAGSSALTNER